MNVSALPDPPELRRRCIALAVLDAVFMPDWELRYYSFDAKWAKGELMASMRDGSGDEYVIGFSRAGVFLKGFAHERRSAGAKLYEGVPASLRRFRDEPAFSPDDVTYCAWWDAKDPGWRTASKKPAAGGSAEHLATLDGDPRTYRSFAKAYYEVAAPLAAIAAVYRHEKLTRALVRELDADADVKDALREAKAAGYGTEWSGFSVKRRAGGRG